jgi:hypothetical protein
MNIATCMSYLREFLCDVDAARGLLVGYTQQMFVIFWERKPGSRCNALTVF